MKEHLFSVGLFSRKVNGLYVAEHYFSQKEIPINVIDVNECAGFGMSMYHGSKTIHVVSVPGGYITGHVLTLESNPDVFDSFFKELDSTEKGRYGAEREKRMFGTSNGLVNAHTYTFYDPRDYKGDDGPLQWGGRSFTDEEISEILEKMGITLSAE